MADEPHAYATWALAMVEAGEESGMLATAFEQIADVF